MSQHLPEEGREHEPDHPHIPVLLEHITQHLACPDAGVLVDGTLGAGGHALALLDANPGLKLIGIDRDAQALDLARDRLAAHAARIRLVRSEYSRFGEALDEASEAGFALDGKADRLLFDIGVSSMQIDQPERGFSFSNEGPLDMRMSESGETALDLMTRLNEEELARIIYEYGEERLSRRIASRIKEWLRDDRLHTTTDLRALCRTCYPRGKQRIDPATRTFQALRIAVNDELGELERMLAEAPARMHEGARLAVISFHSLEDRVVKWVFRKWAEEGLVEVLNRRPLVADEAEIARNPRARSAKLRICERLAR